MRHQVAGRRLNRNIHQRKALFKNLISALILRGKIRTTEAKARSIRPLIDKLVSRAKQGTIAARQLLAAFLGEKRVVNKLVDEVAPKLRGRPGGVTRLTRIERRRGDNAVMVEVALLDQVQEIMPPVTEPQKPKKTVKSVAVRKPSVVKETKLKVKPQVQVARRDQAATQKRGTG